MSNSALISCTVLSPNHSGPRTHAIDRITPHCVVGQCTVEALGALFAKKSRNASSNYGIGADGRIGLYVDEGSRSWCTSSRENDQRAVTIEVASDAKHPYAFRPEAYSALIDLCADICRRNGKSKLLWLGDKAKTLAYSPAPDEMVLTVHRWYELKSCPGDWLYSRMGELAAEVNARLGADATPEPDEVIWSFLRSKGLSDIATAGVMGNLYAESGLVSNNLQDTFETTLGMTDSGYTVATTVREASDAVLLDFERPKDQSERMRQTRAGYAQKFYDKFHVEGDEEVSLDQFKKLWFEMRAELQDNDASEYSREAREWAVQGGIVAGGSSTEFNGMWEDVLSREQMVTLLYRFAKKIGVA